MAESTLPISDQNPAGMGTQELSTTPVVFQGLIINLIELGQRKGPA